MPTGIYKRKPSDGMCTKCGEYPQKKTTTSWCQKCSNEYEKARWARTPVEKRKEKHLKTKYGIDWNKLQNMHEGQDGKCAICRINISITSIKSDRTSACVDHCHETGRIRGLLCNHCNRALGLLKDDEYAASRLVIYLRGGGY